MLYLTKDPAMILYTSDFLTRTYFLSMEERGQPITIICLNQHGHLELADIVNAVGFLSGGVPGLLCMDAHGRYFNEMADYEIGKGTEIETENGEGNLAEE